MKTLLKKKLYLDDIQPKIINDAAENISILGCYYHYFVLII